LKLGANPIRKNQLVTKDFKKNMAEETIENETLKNEEEKETPEIPQEENPEEKSKEFQSAIAQKEHFRAKAEKAEADKKALEQQIENLKKVKSSGGLDVGDYIDISTSLDGLDQKEKEKLAREHKLTGKPLSEIRKDEDFILWQSAYRVKVEKEKSLTPNTNQSEVKKPKSVTERLEEAKTLKEKESILNEIGWNPMTRRDYDNNL
jgi:hypothetical protein